MKSLLLNIVLLLIILNINNVYGFIEELNDYRFGSHNYIKDKYWPKYIKDNLHKPIHEFSDAVYDHPDYILTMAKRGKSVRPRPRYMLDELKSNNNMNLQSSCDSKLTCIDCFKQSGCLWIFHKCRDISHDVTGETGNNCVWCDKSDPTYGSKCSMNKDQCDVTCDMVLFTELKGTTVGSKTSSYLRADIPYKPRGFIFATVDDTKEGLGFRYTYSEMAQKTTSTYDVPVIYYGIGYIKRDAKTDANANATETKGAAIVQAIDSATKYNTATGTPQPAVSAHGLMDDCQLSNYKGTNATGTNCILGDKCHEFTYTCTLQSNRVAKHICTICDCNSNSTSGKIVTAQTMACDVELISDGITSFTGDGANPYAGLKSAILTLELGNVLEEVSSDSVKIGPMELYYAGKTDAWISNVKGSYNVSDSIATPFSDASTNVCPAGGVGVFSWMDAGFNQKMTELKLDPQCVWFRFDVSGPEKIYWDPSIGVDPSKVSFNSGFTAMPAMNMIVTLCAILFAYLFMN